VHATCIKHVVASQADYGHLVIADCWTDIADYRARVHLRALRAPCLELLMEQSWCRKCSPLIWTLGLLLLAVGRGITVWY